MDDVWDGQIETNTGDGEVKATHNNFLYLWVYLFYKTSYIYCRFSNTLFLIKYCVICIKELYKCESRETVLIALWELCQRNIWWFNYLKIPDVISCNRGSRWITPQEVGVSLCLWLPRLFTRCVNMIAFLRLSKESCAYKLIIQPSFSPADLLGYRLSK